jgi:hypothetical protein
MAEDLTPKQRMLNAYRGCFNDRPAVAPELWYYYPAKLLGVDMITFEREVPFHRALKTAFEHFGCEGWGIATVPIPNECVSARSDDRWVDEDTLEVRRTVETPHGALTAASRYRRDEPSWTVERPIKDLERDLPAWEVAAFAGEPATADLGPLRRAWEEVGRSYLLEAFCGNPFFDFYAGAREGGFEAAILDFANSDLSARLAAYQQRYTERLVRLTRTICRGTPVESLFVGCSWSCNSLLGPRLWRQWDKPVLKAVCDEAHRHGRLVHAHVHGRCMETVADLAEIGLDGVCPFERPPGGDVAGAGGLRKVRRLLAGRTTMNGNVHTVRTLIRGSPLDARREVRQIVTAFAGEPRLIVGTGDQVGRETPEENLHAMIDEARRSAALWREAPPSPVASEPS